MSYGIKRKLLVFILLVLAKLAVLTNAAGVVFVYNPDGTRGTYTTIQRGINACQPGGTVTVSGGTYYEALYIRKKIALIGIGTPTIIGRNLSVFTVRFEGTPTKNALISGFIITGGSHKKREGAGIKCINNANPTISNNIITKNEVGILCEGSLATIINNTIIENNDGIYCYSDASVTIINNIISKNNGRGIYCKNSCATMTNNAITENNDGIYCSSDVSVIIINNIISGNNKRGIYCEGSGKTTITNNTITENDDGIYYYLSSPTISISNNIITKNSSYGIYYIGYDWHSDKLVIISYNCVWGNKLDDYYGCFPGEGDIYADPEFIDKDFHLKPNSPCIDSGLNTAVGIPKADKDGNPRIIDGDGDGKAIIDMGAYEFQGTVRGRR